jgi:hypothetical protein
MHTDEQNEIPNWLPNNKVILSIQIKTNLGGNIWYYTTFR